MWLLMVVFESIHIDNIGSMDKENIQRFGSTGSSVPFCYAQLVSEGYFEMSTSEGDNSTKFVKKPDVKW